MCMDYTVVIHTFPQRLQMLSSGSNTSVVVIHQW